MSECVGDKLSEKSDKDIIIDDQIKAISISECEKKSKLNVKISNIRGKIKKVRKAIEGSISTSQDRQSPDGPQWTLTKVKRTGYPEGFSIGAKFAGMDGKFAKYYLLDGQQENGNGWGVINSSIKQYIGSFINKPFVITSNEWIPDSEYEEQYDHPFIPTNNMQAILRHQEKFRVGNIVKVTQDGENGRWYAMIKIDPKFAHMPLPPFCSPALYQIDPHEDEGSISIWEGLHLAGLDSDPAYGPRIALLKGSCTGQAGQCMHQFRMAKQAQGDDTIAPIKQQGQSGVSSTMCDCEEDKFEKKVAVLKIKISKLRKKTKLAKDFKESEHPRNEGGKFTIGGGSEKNTDLVSIVNYNKEFGRASTLRSSAMSEIKSILDKNNRHVMGNGKAYIQKIKKLHPALYESEVKPIIDKKNNELNEPYHSDFKNTFELYRGTNKGELDDMLETGKLGRIDTVYNFIPVTTDIDVGKKYMRSSEISGESSPKVLIKYQKDSLDGKIKSPGYDILQESNPKQINTPNWSREVGDREHRLKTDVIDTVDTEMEIVFFDIPKSQQNEHAQKYSKLGEVKFE